MLGAIGTELVIILVLILANGFFSGSELAIVSARRSRLEAAAADGNNGARQALDLSSHPDRFLATVQVGISFISTFAAAFGGARIADVLVVSLRSVPALTDYAEPLALLIVVAGITYLSLVLGELVPKRLALQHAEAFATLAAPIMVVLATVARPLVVVLTTSVNVVLRLLRQRDTKGTPVTEEDIVYLVREGAASGTVEAGEAQFIKRVFRFTDRPVRTVMTPRTEIIAVGVDTPLPQIISAFADSSHSRLPVYQGTLDNILGVLHAKDLLQAVSPAATYPLDIKQLLRPPLFVFEHQHVDDVLVLFRQKGTHVALVLDEYGQVAGLLTLTSLLEELVGEIPDEHDRPKDQGIVRREDGSWLVDGLESYDDVLELIGLPPVPPQEHGDYNTLAGMILARLGRVPAVGDTIQVGDHLIEIIDMDGNRIDKVLIRPNDHQPAA